MKALAWTAALLLAGCASAPALPAGTGGSATVPLPGAAGRPLPGPLPEGPLTVEAAVALALERNPDLGAALARIEAALAGIEAARSGLWPRLSVEAGYLRADAPSAFLFRTIDARSLSPTADFNDPGAFDNLGAGAGLRWNLWDGGRARLAVAAAEAAGRMGREEEAGVRNTLVAAVASAVLDARAAAETLAADDASVRSLEAQVEETRARVEGGAALRSDLLSLEVRLAEAREGRLRTEFARRLALAHLRRLLALPADVPLDVAGGALDGAAALPASLPAALEEARRNRPEARGLVAAAERARLARESADRAWLPRLDAEGRTWKDDGDARGDFGRANWLVGATLAVDLFDGGARAAGLRRADAALREIGELDRALSHGIALEVESALLRLEEARARHAVTERAVEAAGESLDLVERQFRGGAATVTRFLEAEAARTRARTTEVGARLDVERASVEYARALGRFGGGAAGAGGGAR